MKRRRYSAFLTSMIVAFLLVASFISPQALMLTNLEETPAVTEEIGLPEETIIPETTPEPEVTVAPEETNVPEETSVPEETMVPEETALPEETTTPEDVVEPEVTQEPKVESRSAATDARFEELINGMYSNIPEGLAKVSYSNNYESMEPEPYVYDKGGNFAVTSTIDTGKNIVEFTGPTQGYLEKSPYFDSGYYRINFSHDLTPVSPGAGDYRGIGFIIKENDTDAITVEMNAEGISGGPRWRVKNTTGGSVMLQNATMPKLPENQNHTLEIFFQGTTLVLALNGEIFYDGEISLLGEFEGNGRFGLSTTYLGVNYTIDDLHTEGIGSTERPVPPATVYVKDYEDGNPGNWDVSSIAKIMDDGSGANNILKLSNANGHYVDLASPDLEGGGFSLDFRVVSPGYGFAFNFRTVYENGSIAKLNSFSYAPHEKDWIWETKSNWSGTLGVGEPTLNTWNNLIINYENDKLVIYLNKEKMGEYTYDKFNNSGAGKFGVRLRPGAEIYMDNLIYSSEPIIPEEIKEYRNNFNEGVAGDWQGDVENIVRDGNNDVLELVTNSEKSLLDTGIELNAGTALVKAKPTTSDVRFAIASNAGSTTWIVYQNGSWMIDHNGTKVPFASNVEALQPQVWNTWGVQFKPGEILLNVNGEEATATLPAGESLSSGTFGVLSDGKVYLDDLIYTEKFIPFYAPIANADKLYYLNYFDIEGLIDWTDFEGATQGNGILRGEIASKTTAFDRAITAMDQGVYQVHLISKEKLGVQLGDVKIYSNQGKWVYQIANGAVTDIAEDKTEAGEVIFRLQHNDNIIKLWVNNVYIGEFDATEATVDKFGVYNPTGSKQSVDIEAIGAEEIRIYLEDYTEVVTPEWERIEGSGRVTATIADGLLNVNVTPVTAAVDKATPSLLDQKVKFDFKVSVDDGITTGGRYGFLLRGSQDQYVSIVCDVDGKWSVGFDNNNYNFTQKYSLAKDTMYTIEASLEKGYVSFAITDADGKRTDMGTVFVPNIEEIPGHFGVRGWYSGKTMTIDNLEMEEMPTLPLFQIRPKTVILEKGNFKVAVDGILPRISHYELNGKVLETNSEMSEILINGKGYTPEVSTTMAQDKLSYTYEMNFSELDVVITAKFELLENNVVSFEVTDIQEKGEFLVHTISLGKSSLGTAKSTDEGSSFAWSRSNGEWHGLTESIVDDMSAIEKNADVGVTMAMLSSKGLAISIENNVISGGSKINVIQEKKTFINEVTFYPGEWLYRHSLKGKDDAEAYPVFKVVVAEDVNEDNTVDWQDGAVAYRRHILVRPFAAEDMANNMMYIPFNFASQATDPFLNTLDQAKVLYNFTDGFGQMLLHKGYQDEGHDSGIPSYSQVGVRQGGVDDMKYLIQEGDKYNVKIGVHLNATEYHLDANELFYLNLTGATEKGPYNTPTGSVNMSGYDRLAPGWDWVDTTFYVDQTKDVLSGELEKRFTDLVNKTTTDDGVALDFFYIDVYTGNDYNAHKLLEYANNLGIKIGTEFAGPLEPGSNFVHWGPDLGYPNKGNGSLVYRMVKNDQDIFVGNALFKGQKIAVVSTWGDSKPDMEQGVYVFFNEVLPTKYMQHHGVLRISEDEIQFEENVVSSRNHTTGQIELRKDGQIISTWEDTGTTTAENVRHTAEANSLIPWEWDNDSNVLGLDNGAKLYHWTTTGNSSTWTLTNKFKEASAYDLYELTQAGRVKVATIPVTNGKLTISQAKKNTAYVLYPAGVNADEIIPAAANWGEGSDVLDFAFNAEKLDDGAVWKTENGNARIAVVEGRNVYSTSKENSLARWNRYLEINASGETVYQDIQVQPGIGYELEVWTETTAGRKSTLEVEVDGQVYSNYVTGLDGVHQSNFKYRNQYWQRVTISFDVPAGVTEAQVRLIAEPGDGVVLYDDVKMWKHIVPEDYGRWEGYTAYEDFENVSQGFGIFEYIRGNLQSQLKQRAENEIVSPADNAQGPLFTWVLSGETSLKLAETGISRGIKTSESGLKLEPNTDYVMGFNYTMESDVVYDVSVVSRGSGTVLVSDVLEVFESQGDGETSKYMEYEFTTDDLTDYQVVFKIKSKGTSSRTEIKAFILDDFFVRESSLDITTYPIEVKASENGSIEVDKTEARENENVTVTGMPEEGYRLDKVLVNGEEAETTFKMPADKAVVEGVFVELADKTALEEVMQEAQSKESADYTSESFAVLEDALKAAQEVLEDETVDQETVDQMVKRLQEAMNQLQPKETEPVDPEPVDPTPEDKPVSFADKGPLEKLVNEKGNESSSKYTSGSFADYQDGLTFARQVLANPHATQADVINAILWLNTVHDALEANPIRGGGGSSTGNITGGNQKPEATETPEVDEVEETDEPEATPEVDETDEIDEATDSTEEVTPAPTEEISEEKGSGGINGFMFVGGSLLVLILIAGGIMLVRKFR